MWQFKIGTRVKHIHPACIKEYGFINEYGYDSKGEPYYIVLCDDGSYFKEYNPDYLLPCANERVKTPNSKVGASTNAASILQQAKDCLVNRAVERDKPNGERSMESTVEAFNALTGHSLSESDGWLFMLCLKAARAEGGCFKADDYVDGAAYFALYGEASAKEANND